MTPLDLVNIGLVLGGAPAVIGGIAAFSRWSVRHEDGHPEQHPSALVGLARVTAVERADQRRRLVLKGEAVSR